MINFDMIGRLRGDTLAVYGTGTSPGWMELLERVQFGLLDIWYRARVEWVRATTPVFIWRGFLRCIFSRVNIPTTTNHRIRQTKSTNKGMLKIVNFVDRIVRRLNDEPEFLFTATKDQDEESTPRFKVTLGVIPDYLYAGRRHAN